MSLNISAWSIRNPISPIVLFVVLMLMGVISFMNLPVTRFPNIDVPVVSVTVTQSGAAPSELETQVTKKVEDAVANLTGVKHVISTITDGRSVTAIEFRLEVDTDRAVNDVKDAVAKIRADLPRGIDEPVTERIDVEGQSILTYAVSSSDMTLEEISWHVDDVIKRKLQGLKGVGRITRYGGVDREIVISLNPDRLLSLGVTASEVNRQLRATNVDLAGGKGEIGGRDQTIRTLAGARSVEQLAESKIVLPGGREVRLKDLGRVEDGASEPKSFARLNGEPVVAFAVFRSKGASELTVAENVEGGIKALRAARPEISISLIDDAVTYTKGNYESAMHTLLEGAALAVLVVFIFLKNWRATLIAAIALPLSAVPAFWAMSQMGFSLNLVSLLGITLVTGILVDDAIVEIENIVRHIGMGKSPYRAAMEAADEIGLAVIAITMTIVAVFVPVSFMSGVAGQYFKQFGLTVAAAVLISLLVARLITPMMAAFFMRPYKHAELKDGRIMRGYLALLDFTLRYRYLTLAVGIALFVGSIKATALLPTGFIPQGDTSRLVISAELPTGATLDETKAVMDGLTQVIRKRDDVRHVFVLGGTSPTGTYELRRAALFVRLLPKADRKLSQNKIQLALSEAMAGVPDVRVWYVNERGEREAAISMLSADSDQLNAGVGQLESAMRRVKGFSNVAADAALERPELRITPRSDIAAELGVSTDAIGEAVRVATIGDVGANLAKFNAVDRLVPIRVQLLESARTDLTEIESLRVTTATGRSVPLSTVADVSFGQGPSAISRYDRSRRAILGADLSGLTIDQAIAIIKELPEAKALPAGVRLQESGDAEISGEVRQGFLTAMGIGIVLVLGVLILLFGSIFPPITVILSLPLSFGGVVMALLATNNPVSMPVFIGVLMLMGIVTKNAIMLVEFAAEAQARGTHRFTAIKDAGHKRARPIVMTTIAMAAGMLPSAYGLGDGGEFRSPMAIAVIGGLMVSTVLSLVFVPSFYTVMDDLGRITGRFFCRFLAPREDESQWEAIHAVEVGSAPAGVTPSAPPVEKPQIRRLAAE